jgi:hypothetical protein
MNFRFLYSAKITLSYKIDLNNVCNNLLAICFYMQRDGKLDRDMSKIPHPFTLETTRLFENESFERKNKIYFIQVNHTNPTMKDSRPLKESIQNEGCHFAK